MDVLYQKGIDRVINMHKDMLKAIEGKAVLIAGASGMIGKCLVDILMHYNICIDNKVRIIALSRDRTLAQKQLGAYFNDEWFLYKSCDITKSIPDVGKVDYIIHCADNMNNGIESLECNSIGTRNLAFYGNSHNTKKICFLSTDEVYGEKDIEKFRETDIGGVDCTVYRSLFTESKRAGEAFLRYYCEYNTLDYTICRISKCYGPTMHLGNKKAIHNFIFRAACNDVIELKSNGKQKFSFIFVSDVACGILVCLLRGGNGEVYNISNENSEYSIRELAEIASSYTVFGGHIVYKECNDEEINFTKVQKLLASSDKLQRIGWEASVDIYKGFKSSIEACKSILKENVKEKYAIIKEKIIYSICNFDLVLREQMVYFKEKIPVWVCWWQGKELMPELVKCCLESIKENFPLDRVQINIITKDNYLEYVSLSVPIIEKFERGVISFTHMSDILRAELLYRYGGWWLDGTVYVTSKIQPELLDRKNIYTLKGKEPWDETEVSKGYFTGYIWYVPYSKSMLFGTLLKVFIDYWDREEQLVEYYFINYAITIIIDIYPEARQELLACEITAKKHPGVLQTVLNDVYQKTEWDNYMKDMQFYKLQRRFSLYEKNENGDETFWGHMKKLYNVSNDL